jgi:hypothetical protein
VRVKHIRIRPRAKDDAPDSSQVEVPQSAAATAR